MAGAVTAAALPTLLTSRPQLPDDDKLAVGVRQAPFVGIKLPEEYSLPVRVRNTFIDTSAERSPSLERFFREREVTTCPSAHVGRLRGCLLGGFDCRIAGGLEPEDRLEAETEQPAEAYSSSGFSPDGSPAMAAAHSQPSPALVLSLEDALGAPLQLPPPLPLPSLTPAAWGFGDPNALVAAAPCHVSFQWQPAPVLPPPLMAVGVQPAAQLPPTSAPGASGVLPPAFAGVGAGAAAAEPPCPPPDRPAPGSEELPTVGSAGHEERRCKPCAFFHTVGCTSGMACQFCHLCEAGEKKQRRREKLEARRAVRKARQEEREASEGSSAASRPPRLSRASDSLLR